MWISWEVHRRSRELAAALGAELIEVVSKRTRPWRYFVQAWTTGFSLLQRRPDAVVVQCPSVFLGALAVLLKRPLRYRLALDLHNECVEPRINQGDAYKRLLRWLWRSAEMSVVTNTALANVLGEQASAVCVLPDRIPLLARTPRTTRAGVRRSVVLICTYAPDEPYREVIEAARLLPHDVMLFVTGRHDKASLPAELPSNVQLCGFLPEADYEQLLRDADVLIDLTDLDNCLVCGAYEAVALEKPLVTSDTAALRHYFSAGTVYSQHTPRALASAIETALAESNRLSAEMRTLKDALRDDWIKRCARLSDFVAPGQIDEELLSPSP